MWSRGATAPRPRSATPTTRVAWWWAVRGATRAPGRRTVMEAAGTTGEPFWPLPFPAELRADLTGRVADLRNIGERWGGALTAGVFLAEFVGETEWAHIDIAGPSFASAPLGYMGKG